MNNTRSHIPNASLLTHDEALNRFVSFLLDGCDRFIKAPRWVEKGSKPKWVTFNERPAKSFVRRCLEGSRDIVGLHYSDYIPYIVIDIDYQSTYYTAEYLKRIRQALTDIGLVSLLFQSSRSNGWHLICPLAERQHIDEVGSILGSYFESLGFDLSFGQLEIHPLSHAVRVPFQPKTGWRCLDIPAVDDLLLKDQIAWFMSQLRQLGADWEEVKRRFLLVRNGVSKRHSSSLGSNVLKVQRREAKLKAKYYLCNGIEDFGQTHDAITSLNALGWDGDYELGIEPIGDDSEKLADFTYGVLSKGHNGNSRLVNKKGLEALRSECERAASHRPRGWKERKKSDGVYTRPYIDPETMRRANERKFRECRAKVVNALLRWRKEHGTEPRFIDLLATAGVAKSSLSKHIQAIRVMEANGVRLIGSDEAVECPEDNAPEQAESCGREESNQECGEPEREPEQKAESKTSNVVPLSSYRGLKRAQEVCLKFSECISDSEPRGSP